MDVNSYTAVGRLAAAVSFTPQDKAAKKEARATFRLMINRRRAANGERRADVIPCVAWGDTATAMSKYTNKGKEIAIQGEIRTRSVKKPEGGYNNFWEVRCHNVSFGRDSQTIKAQMVAEEMGVDLNNGTAADLLESLKDSKENLSQLSNDVAKAKMIAEAPHLEEEPPLLSSPFGD